MKPLVKSNAQRGSWAFAQGIDDGMCHISMNGTDTNFNVQICMEEIPRVIENLLRVLEADRLRLKTKSLDLTDTIEQMGKDT